MTNVVLLICQLFLLGVFMFKSLKLLGKKCKS